MATFSSQPTPPKHIAIIMDGNGRWAQQRRKPRIFGHIRGCSVARDIIREATKAGVAHLTLFAFSSENWKRPAEEVNLLMRLLHKWLDRRTDELMQNNIRFTATGNLEKLPQEVLKIVKHTEKKSAQNTGMKLTFALSYGGREEITIAARNIAEKVKTNELSISEIDEALFSSFLPTQAINGLPDVDLLIRTSGELRISNFMLWQLAYAELYFTDVLWPDFTAQHLKHAIETFHSRSRRFGLTSEQIKQLNQTDFAIQPVI